jgi:hypothetical protein
MGKRARLAVGGAAVALVVMVVVALGWSRSSSDGEDTSNAAAEQLVDDSADRSGAASGSEHVDGDDGEGSASGPASGDGTSPDRAGAQDPDGVDGNRPGAGGSDEPGGGDGPPPPGQGPGAPAPPGTAPFAAPSLQPGFECQGGPGNWSAFWWFVADGGEHWRAVPPLTASADRPGMLYFSSSSGSGQTFSIDIGEIPIVDERTEQVFQLQLGSPLQVRCP